MTNVPGVQFIEGTINNRESGYNAGFNHLSGLNVLKCFMKSCVYKFILIAIVEIN